MEKHPEIVIKALRPGLADDYFALFDDVYDNDEWLRFDKNPWWGGCYCTFYDDVREEDEINASKDKRGENREARRRTIEGGKAAGLLAYADGKPVGWCNVALRSSYANPRHLAKVMDPSEKVGSVTCFVVGPGYRGRGIAMKMLGSASELVRGWGLPVVEGYPRNPGLPDPEIPQQNLSFRGSLSMYLKAGFTVHKTLERFSVVRKTL